MLLLAGAAFAQTPPSVNPTSPAQTASKRPPAQSTTQAAPALPGADASKASTPAELVREGNKRFLSGQIAEALEQYQRAAPLKPDSSELAFNLGLSHLKLGEFDLAREELRKAATGGDAGLSGNAMYALGLVDHAEALKLAGEDAGKAVERTQDAIRKYHDVLSVDSAHAGARDAWNKAASLWRQLKDQQPPPQSQKQQGGNDNSSQDDESQQSQQPSDNPQSQDQEQDEQGESDPDQESQQQDQKQEGSEQGNANDNSASSSESNPQQKPEDGSQEKSDADQQNDPQKQNADESKNQEKQRDAKQAADQKDKQDAEEQASQMNSTAAQEADPKDATREQAARQLRRLMDRQRLNEQKRRTQPPQRPAAPPAGKDW